MASLTSLSTSVLLATDLLASLSGQGIRLLGFVILLFLELAACYGTLLSPTVQQQEYICKDVACVAASPAYWASCAPELLLFHFHRTPGVCSGSFSCDINALNVFSDYDQDEDEEYLQPDNEDCTKCEDQMVLPPAYPPPPVPPMGRMSFSETKVHFFPGKGGVPVLPPPPSLKKPLPESRPEVFSSMREKLYFHHRAESSVKSQSTCRQLNQPGPPQPPIPPVKKPASLIRITPGIRLPLPPVSPPAEESGSFKELKLSAQFPPPLPSNKPKLPQGTERLANAKVPRENKPGLLTPKVPPRPQMPGNKPLVLACKPEKALPAGSGSVSARRSPPDGQSFRGASFEKPALPSQAHAIEEDSDDDYEKVELPNSIFVNTSESLEVERMFKSENPTGPPKNGLFCIRNSSTKVGKVLVVWDGSTEKVRNYRIFQQDSKFYLEADVSFLNLKSLVEHYGSHVLPSHNSLKLQFPYGYSGPR
ncbi:hypothetical protein lerEdw1_014861 [Lerista edwardsae]|nr:hypothetical protein lerEdw1_014864 [Lerista edwardsae]KAJ6622688.1 hypothetical protein lerEdw1_014861 [Lerista edwardsae]